MRRTRVHADEASSHPAAFLKIHSIDVSGLSSASAVGLYTYKGTLDDPPSDLGANVHQTAGKPGTNTSFCSQTAGSFPCSESEPKHVPLVASMTEPALRGGSNRVSFLSKINRDSILRKTLEQRRDQIQRRFLHHRERWEQQQTQKHNRKLQVAALEQRFISSAVAGGRTSQFSSENISKSALPRPCRTCPRDVKHAAAAVSAVVGLLDRLKENQLQGQSVTPTQKEAAIVEAVRIRCVSRLRMRNQKWMCSKLSQRSERTPSVSVVSSASAASFRSCLSGPFGGAASDELNPSNNRHSYAIRRDSCSSSIWNGSSYSKASSCASSGVSLTAAKTEEEVYSPLSSKASDSCHNAGECIAPREASVGALTSGNSYRFKDRAQCPTSSGVEALWVSARSTPLDCSVLKEESSKRGTSPRQEAKQRDGGARRQSRNRGVQVPDDSHLLETTRTQKLTVARKLGRVCTRVSWKAHARRRQRGKSREVSRASLQTVASKGSTDKSARRIMGTCDVIEQSNCHFGIRESCLRASTKLSDSKCIGAVADQSRGGKLPTLLWRSNTEISEQSLCIEQRKSKRHMWMVNPEREDGIGGTLGRCEPELHDDASVQDMRGGTKVLQGIQTQSHLKCKPICKATETNELAVESRVGEHVSSEVRRQPPMHLTVAEASIQESDNLMAGTLLQSSNISVRGKEGVDTESDIHVRQSKRRPSKQTRLEANDEVTSCESFLDVSREDTLSPLHMKTPLEYGKRESVETKSISQYDSIQSRICCWKDCDREGVVENDFLLEERQQGLNHVRGLMGYVWRNSVESSRSDRDCGRISPESHDDNYVPQQLINSCSFQSARSTQARYVDCRSECRSAKNHCHLRKCPPVLREFYLTSDVSSSGTLSDKRLQSYSHCHQIGSGCFRSHSPCLSNKYAEERMSFSIDSRVASVGLNATTPARTFGETELNDNPPTSRAAVSQQSVRHSTGVPRSELIFRICRLSRRHIRQQKKNLRLQERVNEALDASELARGMGDFCKAAANPSSEAHVTQWESRSLALSDLNDSSNSVRCIERNKRILRKLRLALKPLELMGSQHERTAKLEHIQKFDGLKSASSVGSRSSLSGADPYLCRLTCVCSLATLGTWVLLFQFACAVSAGVVILQCPVGGVNMTTPGLGLMRAHCMKMRYR